MPANMSFCLTGGRAVFLDTRQNRYFRLGSQPEATFRALVARGGEPDLDVGPLVRLGVLQAVADEGCRLNPAAAPAPTRSLVEDGRAVAPPDAGLTLEVVSAVVMSWASLKCLSLASVVERHRAMRQRRRIPDRGAQPRSRAGDIFSISASFNRTRRIVPIDTVCLLDSLALHRVLVHRGQCPLLVIGVRLNPFAAHCWVQTDDIVLNDAVERATTYTPILVI